MKTILVVYSNVKVDEYTKLKRYAFNTESDVEIGDVLKSSSYDTNIVVVKVLDEAFKYYNAATGKLSNNFDSTRMYDIKKLNVVDAFDDTVIAVKVSEDNGGDA